MPILRHTTSRRHENDMPSPPFTSPANITYKCPTLHAPTPVTLPTAHKILEFLDPQSITVIQQDLPAGYDISPVLDTNTSRSPMLFSWIKTPKWYKYRRHYRVRTASWLRLRKSREPHNMLYIRRQKMRKHKQRKARKRNKALYASRVAAKEKKRELMLRQQLYGILTKGYEFDAEEYVKQQIEMYEVEKERREHKPLTHFHVVPDNVVYPWPNPFDKRDPLNYAALEEKMAQHTRKKNPDKLRLFRAILRGNLDKK